MSVRGDPRVEGVTRDVLVAALCAVAGTSAAYADHLERDTTTTALGIDVVLGLVACGVLVLRRRHPVGVAAWLVPLDVLSFSGTAAYLVAVYTVASRRSGPTAVLLGSVHVVAVVIGGVVKGSPESPWRVAISAAVAMGVAIVLGLYVAARRALVASLRARAERLVVEREQDVERARATERAWLAAEMHDVLAHRISLITLHAGALQVSVPSQDPATVESLDLVHVNARAAMHELRDVVGLLRQDAEHTPGRCGRDDPSPPRPQPTARDIPTLVAQSRQAGLPVDWRSDLDEVQLAAVPIATGRHLYRVVQECLTNVHKHTDRAQTVVSLTALRASADRDELAIEVLSEMRPAAAPAPSNGTGLIELAERITRAGGVLDSGIEDGHFVVRARLPRLDRSSRQ